MKQRNTLVKFLMTGALSLCLVGCAGFFDKDNTPAPTPLTTFTPQARVNTLWTKGIGSGVENDYLRLMPAVTDQWVFAANKNGSVVATERASGRTVWRVNTPITISSGPAAGAGLVVVCSRDGDIVALQQRNGQLVWKQRTSSEVLAAPSFAGDKVLVKAIDGTLTAFAAQDGHVLWTYQQVEPSLILRGGSAPQIYHHEVFTGFANGNLVKLTLNDGNILWQQTIATPQGSFAIQRMVDIDADPFVYNNRVYAATYQGNIAAMDADSGRNLWTHEISSYTGIAADNNRVYVSDAKDHLWAFDADSGTVDWRQTDLQYRNITGPVVMGNYIVVGDAGGYLHWLSKQDGHFIARIKVPGNGILATPVLDNNTLYVTTQDGYLGAYSIS